MNRRLSLNTVFAFLTMSLFLSEPSFALKDTWRDLGDGTTIDQATGLIWEKETADILRTNVLAATYCGSLNLAGFSNWRLPTIKELNSIVDYRKNFSVADETAFEPVFGPYWSNTSLAETPAGDSFWTVNFSSGVATPVANLMGARTRCVQGIVPQ